MQISSQLKKYIKDSITISKSNVIITDLEKVKYAEFIDTDSKFQVDDCLLSNEAKRLIEKWKIHSNYESLFIILNKNDCIQFLENSKINYACQMFLPIVINNSIKGLIILYRISGNYVLSSVKSVENFKKFITVFIAEKNNNMNNKGE
ncbi:MAG: hypothetical protein HFJ30_00795 [Clostridia bacterium]|jgi:hypothetical protein|nr:hypothetical protein [Clostridia bacterium]